MMDLDVATMILDRAPDSLDDLLAAMTPEIYSSLKQSVEIQKWPDGVSLSSTQLENAMQLIILYEHHNLPEQLRTGRPLNQECGNKPVGAGQVIDVIDSSGVKDR